MKRIDVQMNRSDILVPLNLEKHSFEGLEFASLVATEMPIRITLLYVVELNIFPLDRRVYEEVCFEYHERLRVLGQSFFENQPRLSVRVGKAYQEILAEAKDSDAELIVMGIPRKPHHRGLFGIDTVARVVRDAPCQTFVLSNSGKNTFDEYRQASPPFAYRHSQQLLVSR